MDLPYLITGSLATVFYGEPRFTNDIDIVVDLPDAQIEELCAAFPSPEFYLSAEAARRAVAQKSQFNVIHPVSGLKLDFIVPADTVFNRSRLARARSIHPAPDYVASFASPEDVILMKLDFHQRGGSDKHLRDIAGVLRVSGEQLDRGYLDSWARRLELEETWQALLRRVG
ncbi:MAG TPA: hypothetical protein VHR45_08090 [Thermoanaerobaculia bacterium]|nr:hypothetical protein [Thermoanaerobaculia bacterium]